MQSRVDWMSNRFTCTTCRFLLPYTQRKEILEWNMNEAVFYIDSHDATNMAQTAKSTLKPYVFKPSAVLRGKSYLTDRWLLRMGLARWQDTSPRYRWYMSGGYLSRGSRPRTVWLGVLVGPRLPRIPRSTVLVPYWRLWFILLTYNLKYEMNSQITPPWNGICYGGHDWQQVMYSGHWDNRSS